MISHANSAPSQKLPAVHGAPSADQASEQHTDQYQQGVLDQRKGLRALFGLHAEAVFQRFLEEFDGRQIARAETHALQVQHLDEGHQHQQRNSQQRPENDREHHGCTRSIRPFAKPSLVRQRFSARAIRPASVS